MDQNLISIQLSLDEYEIKLLDKFASTFNKPLASDQNDIQESENLDIFQQWLWYRKVLDNFHDVTRTKVVREDWGGDITHGFGIFMHFLSYYQLDYLFFRIKALKQDNPNFLPDLLHILDLETGELQITYRPIDSPYWALIGALFLDNSTGIPDSGNVPVVDWLLRMRRPITVGSESDENLKDEDEEGEDEEEVVGDEYLEEVIPAMGGFQKDVLDESENMPAMPAAESSSRTQDSRDRINMVIDDDIDLDDIAKKTDGTSRWDSTNDSEDKESIPFSIWSLLRKSSILQRRERNALNILEFLEDNDFFLYYTPVADQLFSVSPEYKVWHSGINARITHPGLCQHLGQYGMNGYLVIEDPRQFLEYIPWEELSLQTQEENKIHQVALWTAMTPSLAFERQIFTEEEVFRYCVLHNFYFPDLFQGDQVIFHLTEITEGFVEDLQRYWEKWNDCSVTQNPETKTWYLLETNPGRTFRHLWDSKDRLTALQYFRNLVNHHNFGEPRLLKSVPGISYDAKYENLLEFLSFHEFEVSNETPKSGSRGTVYKTLWNRAQRISEPPRDDVWVALKSVDVESQEELNPIFKELDINFSALQGTVVGFAKFYGITQAPQRLPLDSRLGQNMAGKTFIVSEWAMLGSAEQYLKSRLTGKATDWDLLLRFIWNIASGLSVIHRNGVIHRDLHWGNILVTTNTGRKDLLTSVKSIGENSEILIADLGEGKIAGEQSTKGRKYGPARFRAPKVEFTNAEYTSAADMYSMGQLAKDIRDWFWEAAVVTSNDSRLVPEAVETLIEKLVDSADPKDRPSADEVVKVLQDTWVKGMDNYTFRPERIGFIEYSERIPYDDIEY